MSAAEKLLEVTQNSGPVILDLNFDPGWEDLREKYPEKEIITKQASSYEQQVLDKNPEVFKLGDTNQFLRILAAIKSHKLGSSSEFYVRYDGVLRSCNNFVIGKNNSNLVRLRRSFCMRANPKGAEQDSEKISYVEGAEDETGFRRASILPRLLYFCPSKETRQGKKNGNWPLVDTSLFQGANDCGGQIIMSQMLKIEDPELRKRIIRNSGPTAVIAVPWVNVVEFNDRVDAVFNAAVGFEEAAKVRHPRITWAVENEKQLGFNIPPVVASL